MFTAVLIVLIYIAVAVVVMAVAGAIEGDDPPVALGMFWPVAVPVYLFVRLLIWAGSWFSS